MEIKNVEKIDVMAIDSNTPARYYPRQKTILINPEPFSKLNRDQRLFVLFHELGHAELQTHDEIEADNYAFNLYAKRGNSLKNSFYSLSKTLNPNNPENIERIKAGFVRAANFDRKINHNEKIDKMNVPYLDNTFADEANQNWLTENPIELEGGDSFLGFGKKAKERREQRQEQRAEKKAAKIDVKKAKAEAIRSGSFTTVGAKIVDTVGGIGKKFLGIQDSPEDLPSKTENVATDQPAPAKKNNTTMIIVIVIIIAIIIVAVIYFRNKKK